MLRNIMQRLMSVAVMLSLALLASCTMVVFEGDPVETFDGVEQLTQNRMSKISFDIQWPAGIADEEKPSYITVVMNRIQNTTVHYVYYLDNEGNILESFDVPETPENPEEDGEGTETPGDADGSDDAGEAGGDGETGESEGDGDAGDTEGSDDAGGSEDQGGEGAGNGAEAKSEGSEGAGEDGDEGAEDGEGSDEGAEDGGSEGTENGGEGGIEEDDDSWMDDPSVVHNGYYSIAAIAVTDYKDFIVPAIQEFEDSLEYKMRDVYVTVPRLSKEERLENNYIDFNPVYPYIRNTGQFYYVRPSSDSHTMISSNQGHDNTITLKPQLLTRKVHFTVNVNLEEGVKIDRFIGTISGVPQEAQLMTGNVSDRNTGKVPFEMASEDGRTYKGAVNVFGLFSSDDSSLIVGPGVLTVTVHAGFEEEGILHSRIFHASINIKEEIDKADIMMQTEDKASYRFSDTENVDADGNPVHIREFDIVVGQKLSVTKEMVLTGSDQGFEEWVENDNSGEGLNPEI